MDQVALVKLFGAFFAILNPFIILPIFLSMTDGFTSETRRLLAVRIVTYSAVMCLVVMVAGDAIITFFGVRVSVFRIAGGLVLAQIAWSMLNGQRATSHQGTDRERMDPAFNSAVAFYPMTFPMVVGPGTIATIIIYTSQAPDLTAKTAIALIVLVVLAMVLAVLWFASMFGRALSETMRVIMTRLMGMILLAMALEMVIAGLKAVFPALGPV